MRTENTRVHRGKPRGKPSQKDINKKYAWFIKNWKYYHNDELGKIMGCSKETVGMMAAKARRNGIPLIRKNTEEWRRKYSRIGVDWEGVKKDLENRGVL